MKDYESLFWDVFDKFIQSQVIQTAPAIYCGGIKTANRLGTVVKW